MVQQRVPAVNGDDGAWGDILNQYLLKEHYDDGTGLGNPINGMHKTITIRAGTTAANTAPITFNSGSLMTTPQVGAVEFNDNGTNGKLYVTSTQATVATRFTVAAYDDSAGAAGDIYYRDGSGNFKHLLIGSTGNVLTVSGGVPAWAASGSGLTQQQTMAISSMRI
jgi:hypothetical protein